jgi:hypothetical protein
MTIPSSDQHMDKWRAPVHKELKCGEFLTTVETIFCWIYILHFAINRFFFKWTTIAENAAWILEDVIVQLLPANCKTYLK